MAICAVRAARYGNEASSLGVSEPDDRCTNPFLIVTGLPCYDGLDECNFHVDGGAFLFYYRPQKAQWAGSGFEVKI